MIQEMYPDREYKVLTGIEKYKTIPLSIPLADKTSVSRLEMQGTASKHQIVVNNAEIALFDTPYSDDMARSSFNEKLSEDVKVLDRIDLEVDGTVIESTYIYLGVDSGKIMHYTHKPYLIKHHFGYPVKTDLPTSENSEKVTIEKGSDLKRLEMYTELGVTKGANLMSLYTINPKAVEDAIMISDKVAKDHGFTLMSKNEIWLHQQTDIRHIYESDGQKRPLPKVGEIIKSSGVICTTGDSDPKVLGDIPIREGSIPESDRTYFTEPGSSVSGIKAFGHSNDTVISGYINVTKDYYNRILGSLNIHSGEYDVSIRTKTFNNWLNALNNMELSYNGKRISKTSCVVIVETKKTQHLEVGQKMTNRYGGKGTVSSIFEHGKFKDEYGRNIEVVLAMTTCFKRENPTQLYEKMFNNFSWGIKKFINEHRSEPEKCLGLLDEYHKVIGKFTEEAYLYLRANYSLEELVSFFSNNRIHYRFEPYSNNVTINTMIKLRKVLNKYGVINGSCKVFYNDSNIGEIELSDSHEIGELYYLFLENMALLETSYRGTGGSRKSSGALSKDNKFNRHETRRPSTPIKLSTMATGIMSDSLDKNDAKDRFKTPSETPRAVRALMAGLGLGITKK